MGSCVGKHSALKRPIDDFPLPEPIKRVDNSELAIRFREQNNNKDKLNQIYRMSYLSRDFDSRAFDFCDDLTEIVLSYLSFEDKLHFECLCKQWQRLIFNGITSFDYPLNKKFFEPGIDDQRRIVISKRLLKKCHFIEHLKLTPVCGTDIIALIVKNCYHLRTIDMRLDKLKPIRRDILRQFTENCGQSLECMRFHEVRDDEFNSESGLSLLIVYSEYLLKVRSVKVSIDSDICLKYFTLFTDIFCERIDSLELRLKFSSSFTQISETFEQISRFGQLKSICLILESDNYLNLDLTAGANLLNTNCPQLKTLSLEIRDHIQCSDNNVLKSIECFTSLERLDLKVRSKSISLGSFESFRAMKDLEELKVQYRHLSDDHLQDIDQNCPNLKSIEVKTMENLSDKALSSLSKLKCLVKMAIFGVPYKLNDITDSGVCQLINDCPQIRDIRFECGIRLTQLTFLILNALADSSPKHKFRFAFCWQRTEEQSKHFDTSNRISAHDLWPELRCLPENLTIISNEYFVGKYANRKMSVMDKFERQFSWSPSISNGVNNGLNQMNGSLAKDNPLTR